MAKNFDLVLLGFWLPQAIAQLMLWFFWLQIKEYRFDRFKLLIGSKTGRSNIGAYIIAFKLLLIGFVLHDSTYLISVFLLSTLYFVIRIVRFGIVRPVANTSRLLLIYAITIFLLASTYLLTTNYLLLEIGLVAYPAVGVLVTAILIHFVKEKRKKLAAKAIASNNIKVIGVTGSFGKTTTKDFIAQLLSTKFKTTKTHKFANTPLLVFDRVIQNAKKQTTHMVVEMGAYKKGEIKEFTDVLKPTIGVITAIEEQHMYLFGSLEKIKKAKFELIQGLAKGGTAIFNLTNKNVRHLYVWAKKQRPDLTLIGYYVGKAKPPVGSSYVAEAISHDNKVSIALQTPENINIETNLPADFLAQNALAAIVVARVCGISWQDISKAVSKLEAEKQVFSIINYPKNYVVIDDSKNSPPSGFLAALNHLSTFNQDKYVVATGTIELGKASSKIHVNLAKKIAESGVKEVFLTNSEFANDFKAGLKGSDTKFTLLVDKFDLKKLRSVSKENCAVLLEGRMNDSIRNIFITD